MFTYPWNESTQEKIKKIEIETKEEKEEVNSKIIPLTSIPANEFEILLDFIYTAELKKLNTVELEEFLQMVEWAIFFQISSLATVLSNVVFHLFVTPHSLCPIWNLCARYPEDLTELSENCCELFRQDFMSCTMELTTKKNFYQLDKELLRSALDAGTIDADYKVMVEVVEEWAIHNADRYQTSSWRLSEELLPPNTLFNLTNRQRVLGVTTTLVPGSGFSF